MFCKKCGKEINENAKFCSVCGAATDSVEVIKKEKEIEEKSVKNYLIPSIIAVFICIPFAIPAIVYSMKTQKKLKLNEIKEAYEASRTAFGWMMASYVSIAVIVPIIAVLAAIALPQFGMQIKKTKDAKAVFALGAMRRNLCMTIADLEGNVPAAEDIRKIVIGGDIKAENNDSLVANIKGIDANIAKEIEFENDSSKGYTGYIKCGTAIEKNGIKHEKIPFKYVVTKEEGSEYAEATFQFEDGYTDTKGREWDKY